MFVEQIKKYYSEYTKMAKRKTNFKWKWSNKYGSGLTKKAKAYLSATYKNQYSKGIAYNNKKKAKRIISKSNKRTKKKLLKEVRKEIKKPKEKKEKKTRQKKITKPRIRKQKVANFRSREDPYYISIRVITINPEITDRGLLMALRKLMKRFDGKNIYLTNKNYSAEIDFDNFNNNIKSSVGTERQKISVNEDRILNDGKIHYEILIGRNKPITGTIKA